MPTIHHTITTVSPMCHGDPDSDTGNAMVFRRISRVVGGQVVQIPALSAGALRGVVRRLLWREVFDRCGLSRETVGGVPKAWDRLYAALANGGHIEKAETKVRPDEIRARRDALPVLSLLGAALYTSHMDGRARVSHSWLLCRERGDDALPLRDLLADFCSARHIERDEHDPADSGVTPMPTRTETVITGARLVGHCHVAPSLEASAWAHGLDLVTHLGGKSGQGMGEVTIQHDGDGSAYRAWLEESIHATRAALLQLAGELVGKPGKVTLLQAAAPVVVDPTTPEMF